MRFRKRLFILRIAVIIAITLIPAACAAPAAAPPTHTGLPVSQTLESSPVSTPSEVHPSPTTGASVTGGPPTEAANRPTEETGGLRTLPVEAVNIEIGLGSPIPVEAVASATWPDRCAQLAEIRQEASQDGFAFTVLAGPVQPDCPPDVVGLPVRLALPLNMAEMPPGTYPVEINGVKTSFDWKAGGQAQGLQQASEAANLSPIPVEAVEVQIGVGSPIPVDVVVSGTWPELCTQLAEVQQTFSAWRAEISLLGTPADPACPADLLGLPFRLALPLNMSEKPVGTYAVVVNGVEATFEWTRGSGQPAESANPLGVPVAYIGEDGNIWLLGADGETRQVTDDATPQQASGSGESVSYWNVSLSSDASLLAYQKDVTMPSESGLKYDSSLWAYETDSGQARLLDERGPAGFAWKPASQVLAYGLQLDESYFGASSEAERTELATGIWAVDWDQGQPQELVPPERGFTLMFPAWSGNGQLLSFQEIYNLEGCGWFSYYDFASQEYVAWDDLIGFYSWSPDGSQIAYDRLCYVPTGEERIYLRDRQAGEEQPVSPERLGGYAFRPVIAPQGDSVAYLVNEGGPDSWIYVLYVQALPDGEARSLGQFEQVSLLNWTPDGQYLVFSAGPYESQQVMAVRVADGNVYELARGSMAELATP